MDKIVVIGLSNIDYMGFPFNKLIPKDSNLGTVTISFGGVGRNICENLLRLGHKITFMTCIGKDTNGENLEKELVSLGCNIIKPLTDKPSASYLCINDEKNDMALALCDESIASELNIDFLDKNREVLEKSEYIVLDANLKEEVIDYITKTYSHKKLIADGISTVKVRRFKNSLNRLYLLKVNSMEYNEIKEFAKPQNLIVTKGSKSIDYYDGEKWNIIDVTPAPYVVSTTGCGDALLSGTISGLVKGYDFFRAIHEGQELAKKTLGVRESVYKGN